MPLAGAVGILALMAGLNRARVYALWPYLVLGVLLWVAVSRGRVARDAGRGADGAGDPVAPATEGPRRRRADRRSDAGGGAPGRPRGDVRTSCCRAVG